MHEVSHGHRHLFGVIGEVFTPKDSNGFGMDMNIEVRVATGLSKLDYMTQNRTDSWVGMIV